MRKLLAAGILCLLLCAVEAPASGFVDELLFTSEWWPEEGQEGEFELFNLGLSGVEEPGNSFFFLALRQETREGDVFTLNGSLGYKQMLFLNATAKYGTPALYYGFGGMVFAAGKESLFLPRLNVGGRFGPDLVKLALDVDFYTLLLANAGKLEVGLEILPWSHFHLYGGLIKLFAGTLTNPQFVPANLYQLAARLEHRPFFVGGEVYLAGEKGPVLIGEAGVNFSWLTLRGRVCRSPRQEEFGAYTIGLRVTY